MMLTQIALAAAAALLLRFFVLTLVQVKGRSMLPTLTNGSLVLMLHGKRPRRGQIVICHYPNRWRDKRHLLRQNFVKRVIAVPGETIWIEDGVVYIDGRTLQESYLDPARNHIPRTLAPRTLAEDEYFVMGDNRDASNDSRQVGPIPRRLLVGRACLVLWPPKAIRRLP